MNLYPSILTDSLSIFQEQVNLVKNHGPITTLEIDIIDGFFAPDSTVDPADLVDINFGQFKINLHLMTEEPAMVAKEALEYQDYLPLKGIIGQVENMSSQQKFIKLVKKHHLLAGLSLNIFTPVEEVDDKILVQLDMVHLMSIEAGGQGREFNPDVLPKITAIKKRLQKLNHQAEIIIDGGINDKTLPLVLEAGATSVSIGSVLWKSANIEEKLTKLFSYAN